MTILRGEAFASPPVAPPEIDQIRSSRRSPREPRGRGALPTFNFPFPPPNYNLQLSLMKRTVRAQTPPMPICLFRKATAAGNDASWERIP